MSGISRLFEEDDDDEEDEDDDEEEHEGVWPDW